MTNMNDDDFEVLHPMEGFNLGNFLPFQLSSLHRATQALLASALDQCGMTIAHWRICLCLAKSGPSTLNDIVNFTRLPQSTISRAVARLDERGLVNSRRNSSDRRIAAIEITELGRSKLAQAIATVEARCREAFDQEPGQMETLSTMLASVIARLPTR